MHLRNLLVIHEFETMRKILKKYILSELNDVNVFGTTPGDEGLQKLQEEQFEAVICHKDMAQIELITFYQQMQTTLLNEETPLIVITSTDTEENIEKLTEQGIEHILISPFTSAQLVAKIDAVCSPKKRRIHERVHIPDTTALIHLEEGDIEVKVINLSMAGLFCDIVSPKQYFELLKMNDITIQFPSLYKNALVENIRCRFARINVIKWGTGDIPEYLRIAWVITELPDQSRETLEEILEEARSRLRSPFRA